MGNDKFKSITMENTTHPPSHTAGIFDVPPTPPSDLGNKEYNRTPDADVLQFPEIGIEIAFRRAESGLRAAGDRLKEQIREYPAQSVLLAAAGGYLCQRLSFQTLLVTGFKMFTAFAPPTLVALGICKMYSRRWSARHASPPASPGSLDSVILVTGDA
jgi:hypothetical protein